MKLMLMRYQRAAGAMMAISAKRFALRVLPPSMRRSNQHRTMMCGGALPERRSGNLREHPAKPRLRSNRCDFSRLTV
jgi:hypothetical protein